MKYWKELYWQCRKCFNVFTSEKQMMPSVCPFCDSRKIHAVTKESYELLTNTSLGFMDYQLRTGDVHRGAYGRFIALRGRLPMVPEQWEGWNNADEY